MINGTLLKTEILGNPSTYQGMSADMIAQALNVREANTPINLTGSALRGYLFGAGKWVPIVKKSLTPLTGSEPDDTAIALCKALVDLINSGGGISTSNPSINTVFTEGIDVLIIDGLLSAPDKVAIQALTIRHEPWLWSSGIVPRDCPHQISASDITSALGL